MTTVWPHLQWRESVGIILYQPLRYEQPNKHTIHNLLPLRLCFLIWLDRFRKGILTSSKKRNQVWLAEAGDNIRFDLFSQRWQNGIDYFVEDHTRHITITINSSEKTLGSLLSKDFEKNTGFGLQL